MELVVAWRQIVNAFFLESRLVEVVPDAVTPMLVPLRSCDAPSLSLVLVHTQILVCSSSRRFLELIHADRAINVVEFRLAPTAETFLLERSFVGILSSLQDQFFELVRDHKLRIAPLFLNK